MSTGGAAEPIDAGKLEDRIRVVTGFGERLGFGHLKKPAAERELAARWRLPRKPK